MGYYIDVKIVPETWEENFNNEEKWERIVLNEEHVLYIQEAPDNEEWSIVTMANDRRFKVQWGFKDFIKTLKDA